jgi:hypothetical protein
MEAGPPKVVLPKRKRRWYQFGLGTAFIVMTTFCVWCWSEADLARKRHKVIEALLPYDENRPGIDVGTGGIMFTRGTSAPWPLNWFGEQGFAEICVPKGTPAKDIAVLRKLFPEAYITHFAEQQS